MSYTVKGTLKVINDTVVVSEKFKKRTVVLVDDSGQYPQTIELQSMQDRVSIFDSCKEGDRVEISFNLTGREWTNPQGEVKVVTPSVKLTSLVVCLQQQPAEAPVATGPQPLKNTDLGILPLDLHTREPEILFDIVDFFSRFGQRVLR